MKIPHASYPLPLRVSPLNFFVLYVLTDTEMVLIFFIKLNAKGQHLPHFIPFLLAGHILLQILLLRYKMNNTAWEKEKQWP